MSMAPDLSLLDDMYHDVLPSVTNDEQFKKLEAQLNRIEDYLHSFKADIFDRLKRIEQNCQQPKPNTSRVPLSNVNENRQSPYLSTSFC